MAAVIERGMEISRIIKTTRLFFCFFGRFLKFLNEDINDFMELRVLSEEFSLIFTEFIYNKLYGSD